MNREFLMLAKTYNPAKDRVAGRYVSEKLDGSRVFWDGGLSRGVTLINIPWANITDPKTGTPKKNLPERATGLWSRYGNPIMAPDWFLNQLPTCPLDGELWAGRGNFQTLRSIVGRNDPDERWMDVQFAVFGSPPITEVFGDGLIKNSNFVHSLQAERAKSFILSRMSHGVLSNFECLSGRVPFTEELAFLNSKIPSDGSNVLYLHGQCKLPEDSKQAEVVLNTFLQRVLDNGGEGVMIRDPNSVWTPKRVGTLLKWKPFLDDQATVTGFTSGRQTKKGSKLRGLIGALILDYNGKRLELSGLTDQERKFDDAGGTDGALSNYAWEHPGEDMPKGAQGMYFKVGDVVEFRYRELSDAAIPKEARYLRRSNGCC